MPKIYKRNCDLCGKYYESNAKHFCSHKCSAKYRHKVSNFGFQKGMTLNKIKYKPIPCLLCGSMFKPRKEKNKFCTHECGSKYWSKNRFGKNHVMWRGGKTKSTQGYTLVWVAPNKRMLEHRYVMEKYLGRKLTTKEHVHHINHNKTDNRIENLKVISSSEHSKFHANEQWSTGGSLRSLHE